MHSIPSACALSTQDACKHKLNPDRTQTCACNSKTKLTCACRCLLVSVLFCHHVSDGERFATAYDQAVAWTTLGTTCSFPLLVPSRSGAAYRLHCFPQWVIYGSPMQGKEIAVRITLSMIYRLYVGCNILLGHT